uniref:Uncharacterized protein n=1 Tax=Anopheles funestus TaxID=62324 RepID=A0A182S3U8_ANOFN
MRLLFLALNLAKCRASNQSQDKHRWQMVSGKSNYFSLIIRSFAQEGQPS